MNRSRLSARLLALVLAALSVPASASSFSDRVITTPQQLDYRIARDGSVSLSVCYNWSCFEIRRIEITSGEMAEVVALMKSCRGDDVYDRLQRARIGVWQMELAAQKHLPVLGNDLALNDKDVEVEGRMDCVDNATNTNTFLKILHDLGTLKGWTVGEPTGRDRLTVNVHWTATLIDDATGDVWAVDSWFRPHGHLPFVSKIDAWREGRKPWLPPLNRLNPYPKFVAKLCE